MLEGWRVSFGTPTQSPDFCSTVPPSTATAERDGGGQTAWLQSRRDLSDGERTLTLPCSDTAVRREGMVDLKSCVQSAEGCGNRTIWSYH